MTAEHVTSLYFEGRPEAAKKRLQKLKAARLIAELPRKEFEPAVLALSRKGLLLLKERGVLQEYPSFDLPFLERRAPGSPVTRRHELAVMDVKAALCPAIAKTAGFSVVEATTWPLLNEFIANDPSGDRVPVQPDAFFRFHEKEAGGLSEHSFFLELDRSTENLEKLASKAICYLNFYKSGGFAEKNGGRPSEFRDHPFRVLMVFKTVERRNNMAETLIHGNPPILMQVWLTTLSDIASNPLGAIWIRPVDYRDALEGSSFGRGAMQPTYRRQSARELLVERTVEKYPLFESSFERKKSDQ